MRVLALSSNYEPLGTVSWEKAISLVFLDKVMALSEYENEVRSPNLAMKVPSVIVYKSSKWKRINSVRFSRRNVWLRDEGKCQYCTKKVPFKCFTLDHVNPKSSGGLTAWDNVVTCCYECNQKKGDKTLKESGFRLMKPVGKPHALPFVNETEYHYSENNMHDSWKFWLSR